ncbi:hypothetical protein [Streptomyces sp. NPDC091212]|uniref:hypothetical protein n=1 Tax=Streptomyces sp. NPDC091212 TaxID=3155191 RepID=UPI0034276A53
MSDTQRRFKDCDGDTWTEVEPGTLRITEYASGCLALPEWTSSIEVVAIGYGPLTEIRPDVRALLADVLEEMASDFDTLTSYTDEMTQDIGYRVKDIFESKARELREDSE